jgi:hypothetical protein
MFALLPPYPILDQHFFFYMKIETTEDSIALKINTLLGYAAV